MTRESVEKATPPATHGSPELDEDATKLAVLGADPGPTFADLGICEICNSPEDCLSGKTPCELCGEFIGASPSTASDLRERAWKVLGQTCSYTGTTEGAKLVERIVAEFAAIRAEAKAECEAAREQAVHDAYCVGQSVGWDDAVKALKSVKPSLDHNQSHFWADWLAANRPSPTGRGGRIMRRLTLYRDDSTVQVVYDDVKAVFWTAGNTVLVVSQFTDKTTGAHRYIHWPRERFCWFKDEPYVADTVPNGTNGGRES